MLQFVFFLRWANRITWCNSVAYPDFFGAVTAPDKNYKLKKITIILLKVLFVCLSDLNFFGGTEH